MKASPIQIALCVTSVLLLLARVRDWWLALGGARAAEALLVPPLVVRETIAPRPPVQEVRPTPPPVPEEPEQEPEPEPERPDFSMHAVPEGPDVSEEAEALRRQLAESAERELAAARLRARSMLVNAESQARGILEDAEREAAQARELAADGASAAGPAHAPVAEVADARRQGSREGHAIGLRKGEIDALTRIEQVFTRIETVLAAVDH